MVHGDLHKKSPAQFQQLNSWSPDGGGGAVWWVLGKIALMEEISL